MKKFLSLLVLSTALAGCGGSSDFSSNPTTSPGNALAQTIPAGGGEVAIPEGAGFRGRLLFDPGAAAGTEITLASSVEPPQGGNLPLVGLSSPHATTEGFFWLRLSVNQPTPLSLLEGIRLQGSIPNDHEHYHADLYQLSSPGRAQTSEGQSQFLQEIPGEFNGTEAVFDEVTDNGMLMPGVDYGVRFKSTDQQTLDLTVINDSGVSPCYLTIRGENPNLAAGDQRTYRVTQDGAFVPMDYDDLVNGSADYNILLPADGKVKLPLMASGRIYFSLGEKLKTQLDPQRTPDGPPCYWVAPDGWSDSAKLNFKTLWDWVEF